MMHSFLLYLVSLLPVVVFILVLLWLDSFSLVKRSCLCGAFLWGCIVAFLAGYVNRWMSGVIPIELFVAPIGEEFLKGLGVLFLIKTRRAAFFIDAVLYGATIGAGFAFIENIGYVYWIPDMTFGTAVMRGFGTAVMHCGAVGGTAAILHWFSMRTRHTLRYYLPMLIPAMMLHSFYNSFLLPPALALLWVLPGVTIWIAALIQFNENSIGKWLDMEINAEVRLLAAMQKGEFTQSRAGAYLLSVRRHFSPEIFLDAYCYVKIYLELSLLSKRNLMLAEVGVEVPATDDVSRKVLEFDALRKRIGKTGELALAPLVKKDRLFKWKLSKFQSIK
jgi:RsiW-degrading membrane proteinase PrsW (M82 family)